MHVPCSSLPPRRDGVGLKIGLGKLKIDKKRAWEHLFPLPAELLLLSSASSEAAGWRGPRRRVACPCPAMLWGCARCSLASASIPQRHRGATCITGKREGWLSCLPSHHPALSLLELCSYGERSREHRAAADPASPSPPCCLSKASAGASASTHGDRDSGDVVLSSERAPQLFPHRLPKKNPKMRIFGLLPAWTSLG